ncbi:MAG: UDP-N-acetylmuramoyl-tripeptide--D-alanyl-D-alanine ligase [Mariprofundaceae bacterium]
MRLSGQELQQATQGTWHHGMPESVSAITTDSRQFEAGQTFLALRGPNFDGHQFANQIIDKAQAMIGDAEGMSLWDNIESPQLQVKDTLVALGDIANAWRACLNRTTIIAITGSYGKTTVRSMLAHTFRSVGFKTSETHANLNNLIGVPMTLLDIQDNADIALIECGISESGEMVRLSEIVQPDIAIITGLSSAHGEGLGGKAGIAREKIEILRYLLPQGWCALGEGVADTLAQHNCQVSHPSVTMDSESQGIVNWQLDGTALKLSTEKTQVTLSLSLPARHWASNMALVSSIVLKYCHEQSNMTVGLADIAEALSTWKPIAGRMQSRQGKNDCTILDDSYNANPTSMQAALATLKGLPGNHIAILGDMAELGQESRAEHKQLEVSDVDTLLLVGNDIQVLKETHPNSIIFTSVDDALTWIESHSNMFNGDTYVLIKASRSMQLDRIVTQLCEPEVTHAV